MNQSQTPVELPPEGDYLMTFEEVEYAVQIMDTMQGQAPTTKKLRMVHFQSGSPRMPMRAKELLEWGATFRPAKPTT